MLREWSSRKSTNEQFRILKLRSNFVLNLKSARPRKLWISWLKSKKELNNGEISLDQTSKAKKKNIRRGRRSHSQRFLHQP